MMMPTTPGARLAMRTALVMGPLFLGMTALGYAALALDIAPAAPIQHAAKLKIYAIGPSSGPAGTEVAITGFGFQSDNIVHVGARTITHVAIKSAMGIACTANPPCRGGIQQTLTFTMPDAPPGTYPVWVENAGGHSNSAQFALTAP